MDFFNNVFELILSEKKTREPDFEQGELWNFLVQQVIQQKWPDRVMCP